MSKHIDGQRDLLLFVSSRFRKAGLQFLLTGSLAVSYYGYPRATHDIDFVVITNAASLSKLRRAISGFGRDFIADPALLNEEVVSGSLYTLYHKETGIKVDCWLVVEREFQAKWERRRDMVIERQHIALVSPEDLILTKLAWCKEVWSDRHFRDCVGIWHVQKGKLDEHYIVLRARVLGVTDLVNKMKISNYELS